MPTLTAKQADAIAKLLNERNQLTVEYTRERVMQEADDYRFTEREPGEVVACVQIKRVQWYQFEVCHLTVASGSEGKGLAKGLLREVERFARSRNARLLQCTIREDNERSRNLFESFGFRQVGMFFNEHSTNNVGVYQKVLAPSRSPTQV